MIEQKKVSSLYDETPNQFLSPTTNPKDSPIGPQNVKTIPKSQKSKVGMKGTIENKSCSSTYVDPKTVFEPYPDPKISPLGPQKVKNYPNFSQIQILEFKETSWG